jgi:hypothetical protein
MFIMASSFNLKNAILHNYEGSSSNHPFYGWQVIFIVFFSALSAEKKIVNP